MTTAPRPSPDDTIRDAEAPSLASAAATRGAVEPGGSATAAPGLRIVPAVPAQRDVVAGVLATAFAEDEFTLRLLPVRRRDQRIVAWFQQATREAFTKGGHVYLAATADGEQPAGAALWEPPDPTERLIDTLPAAAAYLRIFGARLLDAARTAESTRLFRPKVAHWYLHALGVLPDRHGQGIGAALLQHGLRLADATGHGIYLEASHTGVIDFYRRHGFQVLAVIPTSGTTPMTGMWRPPATVEKAIDR